MNWLILTKIAIGCAAVPALLFLLNLYCYRPLPLRKRDRAKGVLLDISVLIPARNEEQNIRPLLASVLANDAAFEVIVLDDHSHDATAAIVSAFALRDPRIRLVSAATLPPGWCGKQFACHLLAGIAKSPILLFLDADVRLAPDALPRLVGFMEVTGVGLASGVPKQQLLTFAERLLLPLIDFLLLGFLPLFWMRRTRAPAFGAGCGQLFVARAAAYRACGGHAAIRASLHDGLQLPKVFRRAGFRTDLFDATDLAVCRMYRSNVEVWRGLLKNAAEGLAAPRVIGPMTVLLLASQVLPVILAGVLSLHQGLRPAWALAAALGVWGPRFLAVRRFRQPLGSACLHPLAIIVLLVIQWYALVLSYLGRPSVWKGRVYPCAKGTKSLPAPPAPAIQT